jgi:hypothetical protein
MGMRVSTVGRGLLGRFMRQELVAALIGVVVGAVAAWIKAVLAIREKANEELRGLRIATYPIVYQLTAPLSLWPPASMSYDDLFQLNLALRRYFTDGGLYLSARSRDRYGEMKQLICAYLDLDGKAHLDAENVSPDVYTDLTATARAFRNALTEDLETRRQRSMWWVFVSWQRHREYQQEWKLLMDKVGGVKRDVRPYPLAQMPLSPVERTTTAKPQNPLVPTDGRDGSKASIRGRSAPAE